MLVSRAEEMQAIVQNRSLYQGDIMTQPKSSMQQHHRDLYNPGHLHSLYVSLEHFITLGCRDPTPSKRASSTDALRRIGS